MGSRIRVGQPTGNLFLLNRIRICRKGKRHYPLITKLFLHFRKINTSLINSCRCTCFKPKHFNTICNQRIRQMICSLKPIRTCIITHISINTSCPQISSCGKHHCSSIITSSRNRLNSLYSSILHHNFRNLCLPYSQMFRIL